MIKVGYIVETKDDCKKGIVTRKYAGIHILFSDGSFGYRDSDQLNVIGRANIRKIFRQIENSKGEKYEQADKGKISKWISCMLSQKQQRRG